MKKYLILMFLFLSFYLNSICFVNGYKNKFRMIKGNIYYKLIVGDVEIKLKKTHLHELVKGNYICYAEIKSNIKFDDAGYVVQLASVKDKKHTTIIIIEKNTEIIYNSNIVNIQKNSIIYTIKINNNKLKGV
jgi:hypothetical protein